MSPAALRRDDAHLIERARLAYAKAGGVDQPGSTSDVSETGGITTVTLRNINGILAMYTLGGARLRRASILSEVGAA